MLDGGTLAGNIANDGTLNYDITGSATFSGTLTGRRDFGGLGRRRPGCRVGLYGRGADRRHFDAGVHQHLCGSSRPSAARPTGPGGTLKLDVPSTGPINVANPNDTVIAQPGGNNWINAAVSYTLPANIDALFLFAGAQGTGNSDAAGDALYALDAGNAQTLTGNSSNDTFVVYNSSDVVVPKAGSHDWSMRPRATRCRPGSMR